MGGAAFNEEVYKPTEDVKVGDYIRAGGLGMRVERVNTNGNDERIFHLEIVDLGLHGADKKIIKSRSKVMLIIPKKLLIVTLK